MKRALVALTLTLLFSGPAEAASRAELREKLVKRLQAHPVRKASYWPALGTGASPKIEPANRDILDYVLIDNVLSGFRERPSRSSDESMLKDVRRAWMTLPLAVRRLASARVAAVFLVNDLGGSAYTEVIRDHQGKAVGAFLVIDAKVMSQGPNEWMSWKESTPFTTGELRVDARIAESGSADRVASIRYLLLHELGHVLGESVGAHPPWGPAGTIGDINVADFPFLAIGWQKNPEGEGVVTRFEAGRPGRFHYYQPTERRMANAKVVASYAWLRRTPFATLYSLNSIFDDFAEAFANYVHVEMLGKPYSITLWKGDTVVDRYEGCWEEARCKRKRELLEKYLSGEVPLGFGPGLE